MSLHVAFKCNYNNGGDGVFVGYAGPCTEDIIKDNVEKKRPWCSNKYCPCREYYDNGFRGIIGDNEPCMESGLFSKWTYGAGAWHKGKLEGRIKPIRQTGTGKIAVFTTRFPGDQEKSRKIVGLFKIGKLVKESIGGRVTRIEADPLYRIQLRTEEVKRINFWVHYWNPNAPRTILWGPNLTRFLTDAQIITILKDILGQLPENDVKEKVQGLLNNFDSEQVEKTKPRGPLAIGLTTRAKKNLVAKKYPGGEGKDHKHLKRLVTENPSLIGLQKPLKTWRDGEREFKSGDIPDIVFLFPGGEYIVVEIKTCFDIEKGIYQALKYKTLLNAELCAEAGVALNVHPLKVGAYVVAWEIPKALKSLAKKLGVFITEVEP